MEPAEAGVGLLSITEQKKRLDVCFINVCKCKVKITAMPTHIAAIVKFITSCATASPRSDSGMTQSILIYGSSKAQGIVTVDAGGKLPYKCTSVFVRSARIA
jgi:hypothetical protein